MMGEHKTQQQQQQQQQQQNETCPFAPKAAPISPVQQALHIDPTVMQTAAAASAPNR